MTTWQKEKLLLTLTLRQIIVGGFITGQIKGDKILEMKYFLSITKKQIIKNFEL